MRQDHQVAMTTASLAVTDQSHVAAARRAGEKLAEQLGFDRSRTGQVALVVTELATNIIKHAGHGEVLLTERRADHRRCVEIVSLDAGPGFANIQNSIQDGHSTAGSLGNGLGAVHRISDQFDLFSEPPKGSVALSRIWDRPGAQIEELPFAVGAINVAKPGEEASGDGWSAEVGRHHASIIVADGLGHGLLAAEAATAAIAVFDRYPMRSPTEILGDVHEALRPTRGAAVAVVAIEFERDVAAFAGLGNISGAIVVANTRRSCVSHNGTAGHSARKMQELQYPMPQQATLVLHSDGLGTHWNPADYPTLWKHDPSVIAATLYRDFSRRRDDVTIVVGSRSSLAS